MRRKLSHAREKRRLTRIPPIAIGLPVHNGGPWLRQTIPALLDQTFRDFVLIISDNGSIDDTRQICEAFANKDSRVRYYRNARDIGVFANYNRAFKLSQSQFFKWHSANDLCAPTFLEICFEALNRDPNAVAVYPGTILFTDDPKQGEIYPYDFDLSEPCPVERFKQVVLKFELNNAINGLIRSSALRKTSMHKSYLGSDVVVLAELALQGTIKRIPQNLFYRCITPEAASVFKDNAARKSFFASAERDVLSTPNIDLIFHYFAAAFHAPLPFLDRLNCASCAARLVWRRRRRLPIDLVKLGLSLVPSKIWLNARPHPY